MKSITFPANEMFLHILSEFGNPMDLDDSIHKGFTVGNGKKMYWYFVWHQSGNCTIYDSGQCLNKRYIKGDQLITVHFKTPIPGE